MQLFRLSPPVTAYAVPAPSSEGALVRCGTGRGFYLFRHAYRRATFPKGEGFGAAAPELFRNIAEKVQK